MYLNEFTLGIIAPAMVATSNDWRATMVLRDYGKPAMTTNIVKPSDDAVLRKNQEDWICPNIVLKVRPHLLEP